VGTSAVPGVTKFAEDIKIACIGLESLTLYILRALGVDAVGAVFAGLETPWALSILLKSFVERYPPVVSAVAHVLQDEDAESPGQTRFVSPVV
jgi:hypothetical protein